MTTALRLSSNLFPLLVPLRDVTMERPGTRNPADLPDKEFEYVDISGVDNEEKRVVAVQRLLGRDAPSRARKIVRTGDVLVSTVRPNLNAIAVVPQNLDGAICSTGFCVLRATDRLLAEYLFYFVQSPHFLRAILEQVSGAMFPATTDSKIRAVEIPVPSLTEQRRIVDILKRADGIRRLRKQAIQTARELIPALFVDMFGDPATNPKGWPIVRLGDLAEKMSDGPFGSNLKTSHYTDTGVRVIRLQNIGVGNIVDADKAYVSEAHFAVLSKHRCLPGDVIIGTLGDPNLRAVVLPASIPEALNKADCVQFRCNPFLAVPEYICWLMNMPATLRMASQLVQGITRARISMGRLRELHVPIPELPMQLLFAERVEQIRSVQSQQAISSDKAENSFSSLLHRAYRGDL